MRIWRADDLLLPMRPHRRATVAGLRLVGGTVRSSQDADRIDMASAQPLSTVALDAGAVPQLGPKTKADPHEPRPKFSPRPGTYKPACRCCFISRKAASVHDQISTVLFRVSTRQSVAATPAHASAAQSAAEAKGMHTRTLDLYLIPALECSSTPTSRSL
jgi:hypothetical protein